MNLQNWLAKVVAERARILARIGPVEVRPSPAQEREAIERGAYALIEWERASGLLEEPAPAMTREEEAEEIGRRR